MPRIRHRKGLRPEDYEDLSHYSDEPEELAGSTRLGQSYLSDANVIASLPDNQLQSVTFRYKQLYELCREELRIRELTNRSAIPIAWPGMFGPGGPVRRPRQTKTRRNMRLTKQELRAAAQLLHTIVLNRGAK
jgi:hypothetical protein